MTVVGQRILFVAAVPSTAMFIAPLADELRLRGFRTALAVGAETADRFDEPSFDTVFRLPPFRRGSPPQLASAGRALVAAIRSWRPALLHLHTPYAVALGRLAARVTQTDHIAVVHGTLFDFPGRAAAAYRAEERGLAWLTPLYVAVNPEDADEYRRIAPRSRVLLAPCGGLGIDLTALTRQADSCARPTPADGPQVLVLGRMTPDKGLDLCVEAWTRLRESVPSAQLCFVGSSFPGEPRWDPPRLEGISHLPFTRNPGSAIASSSLLLSGSAREGFAMVVAEALLVGVPVVAVTNRGSRRIAALGVEGLSLLRPDPDLIAEAMVATLGGVEAQVPPEVRDAWDRKSVVDFHAALIGERVGGFGRR